MPTFGSSWLPSLRTRREPSRRGSAALRLEALEDRSVPAVIGTPTQNFVEQVYRDVLHRPADTGGLNSWSQSIDSGHLSRQEVTLQILGSDEGLRTQVNDLYLCYLGRQADPAGLQSWTGYLRDSDHSLQDLTEQLISSPEYNQRAGGTDQAFLDSVYQDTLCRTAGTGETDYWRQHLQSNGGGDTRQEVVHDILDTQEADRAQVTDLYRSYLRREPDAGGLNYWSKLLQDDHVEDLFDDVDNVPGSIEHDEDALLRAVFLGSGEYRQNAQSTEARFSTFASLPCCDNENISLPGLQPAPGGFGYVQTGTGGTGGTGTTV